MSDLIKAWLAAMTPEDRSLWHAIAESVDVTELTRNGKRIIRLTHRPTGLRVEKVRGASKQQSYLDAFKELTELLSADE